MKPRTQHKMRKGAVRDAAAPPWRMSPQKDTEDDRGYSQQDASAPQLDDEMEESPDKSVPDTDEQGDPRQI